MRTPIQSFLVLALAGCNSLLGIPSGGDLVSPGDGPPGDVSTVGNCESEPATCGFHGVGRIVGQEGERLVLEGTFGDEVMVEFPGAPPVAAQLLGAHRAEVEIPVNATRGDVSVMTAGRRVGSVPFRGTSFKLGLTHFQTEYSQGTYARRAPLLFEPRGGAAVVTIGDQVVVLGGRKGDGTPLNDLEASRISADGTLGRFVRNPDVALSQPRSGATAHVIGNRLFVIGGKSPAALATTEVATLTGTTISTFAPGPMLATPRAGHTSVVIGDGLFVVGGEGVDGDAVATIERAPINPDGTLGPFEIVSGVELVEARVAHMMVVIGDSLYVIGGAGRELASSKATIERAPINGDGTLGPFAQSGTLGTPRAGGVAMVVGDSLVVMGGVGAGAAIERTVERANIQANNNSLGLFAGYPGRMIEPRAGAALALVGNNLHVIGGLKLVGAQVTAVGSVEHTSLIQDGSFDAFLPLTGATISSPGRTKAAAVVFGRDVLQVNGIEASFAASNALDGAAVTQGGTLEPFAQAFSGGFARSIHRAAVAGDFIHILGGSADGVTSSASVQSVTMGADGPVSIANVGGLANGRNNFTAVNLASRLYVFAGDGATASVAGTVEFTTLNAAGAVTTNFSLLSGVGLDEPRNNHCSVVIGTFVYHLGGVTEDNNLLTGTVERQSFSPDAGILADSVTVSGITVTPRASMTCAVIGKYLYVFGSTGGNQGKAIERAEINPGTYELSPFEAVAAQNFLFEGRFNHNAVELTNSIFMLGGDDGNTAAVPRNSIERATIR